MITGGEILAQKEAFSNAIKKASEFIKTKTPDVPSIGIVLGTGLGPLASQIENPLVIPFEEIPNFPTSTVAGHSGNLIIGQLGGKTVAVMQGRVHYYEGYDTVTVTFPVRVLAAIGIKTLILTNACGAVNKNFAPGDLMVINDHLSLFCPSPLRGGNLDEFGDRFIDMSRAYAPELIALTQKVAGEQKLNLHRGVYGFWQGPTFETAAEIRAFMALGADVVGMSTVPETIVANHCGLKTLGISLITNMTCIYDTSGTSHEDVQKIGMLASRDFIRLIKAVVGQI